MTHHLISPTAKLVAYMRARTDIPYSAEISRITDSEKVAHQITNIKDIEWWMAGGLEMRYKSLSALVTKICADKKITNILELAAGVLPRGVIMIEEKQRVLSHLGVHTRPNLILKPLNALEEKDMSDIVDLFPKGPVCIINEGLLPYLSREEKTRVAKNIIANIRLHGGVWITPDISSSDRIGDIAKLYPEIKKILGDIHKLTQRDMQSNNFGTTEEMKKFYGDIGFMIKEYNQRDLVPTLSVEKNLIPADEAKRHLLEALISSSKIWVLE